MKRSIFVRTAFFLVIFGSLTVYRPNHVDAEQLKEDNVSFRWAFGAVVGPEDDRKLIAITRDSQLKTGDKFKMFVELKKKCFVYLIFQDSLGEIQLLFPKNFRQFNDDYQLSKKYYIPAGDLWFALDEKIGHETFHLLASSQRLAILENLIADYESSASINKSEIAKKIVAEIQEIKRKHKKLQATAERPVQIAGSLRGTVKTLNQPFPDLDIVATEISTPNFYGRTFTIDHK